MKPFYDGAARKPKLFRLGMNGAFETWSQPRLETTPQFAAKERLCYNANTFACSITRGKIRDAASIAVRALNRRVSGCKTPQSGAIHVCSPETHLLKQWVYVMNAME